MHTTVNQRWRSRRDSYRPAGEVIDTSAYEVASIRSDNVVRAFVAEHHYAKNCPPLRRRFGLYRADDLVGVALFSVPQNAATYKLLPGTTAESCDLGRFVLLDDVPANGESWFLARCFELLRREGFVAVVSFSDPVPRTDASGRVTFTGHIGTIYQASNAVYMGVSKPETKYLLPDGDVIATRKIAKVRAMDSGYLSAVALLEELGADAFDPKDPGGWADRWRDRLCRPFRHSGNHKYAWALERRAKRHLPDSLPYPKLELQPA